MGRISQRLRTGALAPCDSRYEGVIDVADQGLRTGAIARL